MEFAAVLHGSGEFRRSQQRGRLRPSHWPNVSQRIGDGPGDFALFLARQAVRPPALRLSAKPAAADPRGISSAGSRRSDGEESELSRERPGLRLADGGERGERSGRV